MDLSPYLTKTRIWEAAGALALTLWGMYKKELQDYFKASAKRLWAWLRAVFNPPASRVSDQLVAAVVKQGMGGLTSYLYLLLKEYAADRITVTEYVESEDGSVLATCLVEVRSGDMKSVQDDVQKLPVPPSIWTEVQRWHNQFLRAYYVPDARLLDNAALRVALLDSKVWSAYYHTLPDAEGKCRAVLALSWHDEHPLSDEQLRALHLSGRACETVLLLMVPLKPTSKP